MPKSMYSKMFKGKKKTGDAAKVEPVKKKAGKKGKRK